MGIFVIIMMVLLGLVVLDIFVFLWVVKRTNNTKASSVTFSGFYYLYKYLKREK